MLVSSSRRCDSANLRGTILILLLRIRVLSLEEKSISVQAKASTGRMEVSACCFLMSSRSSKVEKRVVTCEVEDVRS